MKTAVVYYSETNGNTKNIALRAATAIGADTFEIKTVKPYPKDYRTVVEQGKREVEAGYMPEIKADGFVSSAYDRVIICTPTWWYTMAPAVLSFLKSSDLSGVEIILLQTHGGWPGHTLEDMRGATSGTVVGEMQVQFDSQGGAKLVTGEAEIKKWIDSL